MKGVHGGSQLVARTSMAFNEVSESTGKATEGYIAAATGQQAAGISQLNTEINGIDSVVQHTAVNAEESASAAEQLRSLAVEMEGYHPLLKLLAINMTLITILRR
jgi:methyl-accepting chemotaxis protein